jgi:surfactin synthase thioesterase subunit
MSGRGDPWLAVRGRNASAPVRLFCLPHAGSGAVFYQPWVDLLPGVDVCRVQLPGRETRFLEPAFQTVGEAVPALAEGLRPHLDRPFALFGHSLGALLAFELVRHLHARGGPQPIALFPSAHRAPHLPHPRPPVARASQERFLAEVRWMGGTREEFLSDPEILDVILPTLRADVNAFETYAHEAGEPLSCAVTVFGGAEDKVATPAELEPWRQHAAGPYACHILPGDHFFLDPQRERLLGILRADLQAALRAGGSS